MKKLTKKEYWNSKYINKININNLSKLSFYLHDHLKNIKPYIKPKTKIIEIGCAPGNILILCAKKFKLKPYGIEYAKEGTIVTQQNFKANKFDPKNIYFKDFFDNKFQKQNKEIYDVVCSFGFIEHFDKPSKVIDLHCNLLKKGGILWITVPNLLYINKKLTMKKILDGHNLKIMKLSTLKNSVPKNIDVKLVKYYGGALNFGLHFYDNKILEILRLGLLLIQRIVLDPLTFLLSKIGIKLNNKFLSPGIVLIGIKK